MSEAKHKTHDARRGERHSGAAEEARDEATRALRGERSAVPPSDLPEGTHPRSHAAHLEIAEEKPRTKPEGDLRQGSHPGGRRQP